MKGAAAARGWSRALAGACAAAALGLSGLASASDEVSIFVPRLQGPPGLSSSVTTALVLQLWQTLRRADPASPGVTFGAGAVKSFAVKQPPRNHRAAEAMARDAGVLAQMALWGEVQPYGDGAVVQAFLSLPEYPPLNDRYYADFRKKHEEHWLARVPVDDGEVAFRVDLPRRQFAFEPIVVPRQVIERYSSIGAIALYDPKDPARKIGSVGSTFVALEQRGESALVRSGNITGIVRLPEISKHRSEIVDFVGGLARVYRGDWSGAIGSLRLVAENPRTPTDLRIDSHLYMAMARSRLGQSGQEEIGRALELNPYLARTAAYAIMERLGRFAHMTRAGAPLAERRGLITQARELLERHRRLFLKEDPWVKEVASGLGRIEAAYFK
jgi:hypothetical protein